MKQPKTLHAPANRLELIEVAKRLLSRCVNAGHPDRCWLWEGCHNTTGYGTIRYRGRNVPAHRLAFALVNGVTRGYLTVHHSCHVRDCCNPAHLTQLPLAAHNNGDPTTGDEF